MNILSRYIIKEFIRILFFCLVLFVALYVIIDFVQKVDNFIEAGVSQEVMASYFYYKLPYIVWQILPPATLISVVILFSLMIKKREIQAMMACGINIYKVFRLVFVVAVFLSVGLFLFSEVVVRPASAKSNHIWMTEVEKRDPGKYYYGRGHIWYKGENRIYWIWSFDQKRSMMIQPTFYFFDDAFRLLKRVSGQRAVWQNGAWRVEEGAVQALGKDGEYHVEPFDYRIMDLPETPETFVRPVRHPEEMSYWQLKRYAQKVRQEGYDNTRYLVDMHIKTAYPWILLIMAMIGIPVALLLKRVQTPLAVCAAVGICFLYMLIFGFSRSLGLSGALPPFFSAWLANLVFFLFGLYLMMRVER
ncbi:MAG: LPS export ABC transporter permease LptG [Desulfobacteraceae bacterium]|jgi:lipopolysaccharide export system permease protein